MNSTENLTEYNSNKSFLFKKLTKYKVFKKCNFKINKYYWQVKTMDSQYFYTDTDDTQKTLHKILKVCKISQLKKTMVNNFFEDLLVSHLCKEDGNLMEELSQGKEVKLPSGITMKTEDFFRSENIKKTPDIHLEYNNEVLIFDAYNGTCVGKDGDSKEVVSKLKAYQSFFQTDSVYVFTSNVKRLDQLVFSKKQQSFAFYALKGDKLVEVNIIEIGDLKIDLMEINSLYFQEYRIFYQEIDYWLNCKEL